MSLPVTRRAFRVWQRNFDVYKRNWRNRIAFSVIEPFTWFLAIGLGLGGYVVLGGDVRYVDFVAPGLLAGSAVPAAAQAPAPPVKLAILGDSKAEALFYGLVRESRPDQAWVLIGKPNFLVDNPVNALISANFIGILAWAIGLGIAIRHGSDSTRAMFADLCIPEEHRAAHIAGLARWRETGEQVITGRRLELPALRSDGRIQWDVANQRLIGGSAKAHALVNREYRAPWKLVV